MKKVKINIVLLALMLLMVSSAAVIAQGPPPPPPANPEITLQFPLDSGMDGQSYILNFKVYENGVLINPSAFYADEVAVKFRLTGVVAKGDFWIERAGENIRLTWDQVKYPNPIIYVLTGDGTGQYVDNNVGDNWKLVTDASIKDEFDSATSLSDGELIHKNQVGNVSTHPEVYYKIFNGAAGDFGAAPAVGKFDAVVSGAGDKSYKYSFVSIPFGVTDTSANYVFGSQVASGDAQASATELWEWTGTTFGNQQYLNKTAGWENIGGFGSVQAIPGIAYVFKTKQRSADIKITMVGTIMKSFTPIPIAANLYSFIANPYPINIGIASVNLADANGVYAGAGSGMADQLWGWTGDTFGDQAYYKTGTGWEAIGGFSNITSLQPGMGFVYRRNSSAAAGGFNWGFTP